MQRQENDRTSASHSSQFQAVVAQPRPTNLTRRLGLYSPETMLKLFAYVVGLNVPNECFPVDINSSETVSDLKGAIIKAKNWDVPRDSLTLYLANIPDDDNYKAAALALSKQEGNKIKQMTKKISGTPQSLFRQQPEDGIISVVAEVEQGVLAALTPIPPSASEGALSFSNCRCTMH